VVFSDGLSRLQYFQQFEELYSRETSLSTVEYGKLYNLSEITEFLVILTQAARAKDEEPYTIDVSPEKCLIPQTVPFDRWKASDWKSFRESLIKIQTSILRRDATASIDDIFSKEGENREIDPSRANDPWFTDKLFKVLDLFTLHEKLAPFREAFEITDSIESDEDEALMPLSLPKKLKNDFMVMVEEEEEKRIKKAFLSLLKNEKTNTFHSPSTIRRLLDDPSQPHSFAFFLNRASKLMRAWTSQVFDSPTIIDVNLSSARKSNLIVATKSETGQARAFQKLQRSRARLNEHVDDPLADIVAAAATIPKRNRNNRARNRKRKQQEKSSAEEKDSDEESDEDSSAGDPAFTVRSKISPMKASPKKKRKSPRKSPRKSQARARGTMLDKKKSATQLNFTQEEEEEIDSEDIDDPDQEDEVLSDVKKRAKIASPSPSKKRKSQQKMYEGRKTWTDAEKNAVIEGISRFGAGKWAQIKSEYCVTLKFRTSGQIKDCYRTLKKRGEFVDDSDNDSNGKKAVSEEDKDEQEEKEEEETQGEFLTPAEEETPAEGENPAEEEKE